MNGKLNVLLRLTPYLFLILPIITSVEVFWKIIPALAFYAVWFAYGLCLSCLVIGCMRNVNWPVERAFIAVLMTVVSLTIIVPLSIPLNVLDNGPSVPLVVQIASQLVGNAHIPQTDLTGVTYVQYPLALLLVSITRILTGIKFVYLVKFLGVFESIFPALALFALIKPKNVALVTSLVGGLSPLFVGATTHFAPPSLAGSIFLPLGLILFWKTSMTSNFKESIVLLIVSVALTFTDIFDSLVLIVFMFAFLAISLLLQQYVSKISPRIAILSLSLWLIWFVLGSAAQALAITFAVLWRQILQSAQITTAVIQSTGGKSPFLTDTEYITFGLLICFATVSAIYFRSDRSLYTSLVIGVACTSAIVLAPWILGYELAGDLAPRSELVLQLGASPALATFFFRLRHRDRLMVLAVVLMSLLVFNSLAYGVDNYRYDPSAPLNRADTRLGLEAWNSFGSALCQFGPIQQAWGVSLGSAFTSCVSIYRVLGPSASKESALVQVADLENLTSIIGKNQLVVLRESLNEVSDWPQSLPNSVDQTFQSYDIVLRSGDAFLVYTY